MVGRLTLSILTAFSVLLPQALCAQEYAPVNVFGQHQPWVQPAGHPPPAYSPPGYAPLGPPPGGHPPYGYAPVDPRANPAACPPPVWGRAECDVRGFAPPTPLAEETWEDGPLEKLLAALTHQTWLRVEYLLWQGDEPGDVLLGAKPASISNPREPFLLRDPATDQVIGIARVPDLSPISLTDLNGIRGTYGIPLTFGDTEFSIFALQNAKDKFRAPEVPTPPFEPLLGELPTFVGTSVLVNGQPSNSIFLYDRSFTASFRSEFWGTQAKLLLNMGHPAEGFRVRPLIGFQYLSLDEELNQVGEFDAFGESPVLRSTIDSTTKNDIFGPTFGLRAEFIHPWFTVGVEPKLMVGIDRASATVTTNNFRGPGDPEVVTSDRDNFLSPVGELGAFARIPISEHLAINVSYNVIWASRITRPQTNIFYNDPGDFFVPPEVVLRMRRDHLIVEGLTVGGEFQF